jgi:hypothetical protein
MFITTKMMFSDDYIMQCCKYTWACYITVIGYASDGGGGNVYKMWWGKIKKLRRKQGKRMREGRQKEWVERKKDNEKRRERER